MGLKSEFIHAAPAPPIVVIFGGSLQMQDIIVRHFEKWGKASAYGTLSEEDGLQKLKKLSKVDIIVIGARYDEEQLKESRKELLISIPKYKLLNLELITLMAIRN